MQDYRIVVEPATPANIAPFGHYVGAHADVPKFAAWPGVDVYGATPLVVGDGGEMLLVRMDARAFPVTCGLIERHPKHSQTYLPFNGKPFVMLLGAPTDADVPDYAGLRAFLFDGGGIVLHPDVWHDFPYAIEDETQFAVVLRSEAHRNDNAEPAHPYDADGPDLQRRDMRPRASILIQIP